MTNTTKIDQYLARAGWSASYLSKLATGNSRAIENIKRGTASVATHDAVLAYMRANPVQARRKLQAK
tara:strand:+ start:2177 stop:2377 length:201 start_codon:yes stop_codon:yes gene_type:complete